MDCTISEPLRTEILDYLDSPPKSPTLHYLNRLIHAYVRKVPWESVSRILKRQATPETRDCPRMVDEFWEDAIQYGYGGTCFESNLAFYSLLMSLGYEGYLTVNDMGDSVACHAATILIIARQQYLVDVTIPIHAAIRVNPRRTVSRSTAMFDYAVRPVAADKYEVERSRNPRKNLFTLIDIPVSLTDYRAIMEDDYSETMGRFLKNVVITKVVNEKALRFFGDQKPYKLESINRAGMTEMPLEFSALPRVLAESFQLPEEKISAALALNPIPA